MRNPSFNTLTRTSLIGWTAIFLCAVSVQAQPRPELAKTPPMGWNSWNYFGKRNINEEIVHEVIDAMVTQGLRDAGYIYVVVDGGWRDTKLGPNGELLAHPVKFPHSMKALADYAHSKGLKFGLHTVPGTHDCGGDPVGGYGHEKVQMKQFVDWGIDFIKLDHCIFNDSGKHWTPDLLRATYAKWSDLLAHCGRPIVLSMSCYRFYDWYPEFGQMGRTTTDIGATFDSSEHRRNEVMAIAETNNESADFAGKGYWNDPDMLRTGNPHLTQEEQKSHFALWCVMTAPLLLGDDPRIMKQAEKDIVLNRDAIAIDQDPTEQGRRVAKVGEAEVWEKKLAGNRLAVLLLNRNKSETNLVTADWKQLGLSGEMNVKDVYGGMDLGSKTGAVSMSCPPHGCHLLLLSPSATKIPSR